MFEFTRSWLRGARGSLLWWSVGLCAYAGMLWAFYPALRGNTGINDLLKSYPQSVRDLLGGADMSTPGGYLFAELFSFMLPFAWIVLAALWGSRAIAGDEEAGRLELPLSGPHSRSSLLAGRSLGVLLGMLTLGAVTGIGVWALGLLVGSGLGLGPLLARTLLLSLGCWVLAGLALAAGAATGRAGVALGASSATGFILFLMYSLGGQVSALRDLRHLLPFWPALGGGAPGTFGTDQWLEGLTLLAVGLGLVGLAIPLFNRRDVGG